MMKGLVLKETVVPYWHVSKTQEFGKHTWAIFHNKIKRNIKFGVKLVDRGQLKLRGFAKPSMI